MNKRDCLEECFFSGFRHIIELEKAHMHITVPSGFFGLHCFFFLGRVTPGYEFAMTLGVHAFFGL